MRISEVITALEGLRQKWGDVQVGTQDAEWARCDPVAWAGLVSSNRGSRYPAKDDEALGDSFVLLASAESESTARDHLMALYAHEGKEQAP